jgi:hypothetical protein
VDCVLDPDREIVAGLLENIADLKGILKDLLGGRVIP